MVYVVLLGMIAGFLALRLYTVLGRRTGHEQPMPRPAEERALPIVLPRATETPAEPRDAAIRLMEGGAEIGLRAIGAADSSFDVTQFLLGAKSAYKIILEAFWSADVEDLAALTSDEVSEAFVAAIEARSEAGHVLDNRLVSIERALITHAALVGREARITVRFDADIAAVTRDAEGNVIAGSLTDAVVTHDLWTFAKQVRGGDANWKLVETDEA
ncbi:Tim44/TimA family putative adaptor protein [Sphingomonas sp. GlSt437]|uniref:Tim44/TimA family putative adaptor protein n=1 Tax=Sphingomonas sp. GlSt437 TaxID=3389970 RepID=UPI003A8A965A